MLLCDLWSTFSSRLGRRPGSVVASPKHTPRADYLGIITADEIQVLRDARRGMIVHPVANLALAENQSGDDPRLHVAASTERSARLIYEKNAAWLRSLRPRLLDTEDFTSASSALGEIRAYGALLETWMKVRTSPRVMGSNASPEFEVNAGDGEVIVEVHSRQLDKDEIANLDATVKDLNERHRQAVAKGTQPSDARNIVTMVTTETFPTGAPNALKAGDTVATNTISKISAIKADERQVDETKPFVLWLDLQDPGVWGFPVEDDFFAPVMSVTPQGGEVGCGPFWYALYGRRGDPLLESRGFRYATIPLAHDGRFFQKMKYHGGPSRVSAVMFSTPRSAILMENPLAIHRLPDRTRAALLKVPDFRLDLSILDWDPGTASDLIESQRRTVASAATKLTTFDAGA